MATFSKLSWQKQLRGHHLSPAQYMVLMTVYSYSGKDGANAHPGMDRVAADTHLSRSTVKRALDALTAGLYLLQTHAGICRGDANVYTLGDLTLAAGSPLRGSPMTPLTPGRGSSDAVKGFTHDPPSDPLHQIPQIQEHGIIPTPSSSASSCDDVSERWSNLRSDYEVCEEWLEEQLGSPLTGPEGSTALGMFEDGRHVKAIFNTLNRDRRAVEQCRKHDPAPLVDVLISNWTSTEQTGANRWAS